MSSGYLWSNVVMKSFIWSVPLSHPEINCTAPHPATPGYSDLLQAAAAAAQRIRNKRPSQTPSLKRTSGQSLSRKGLWKTLNSHPVARPIYPLSQAYLCLQQLSSSDDLMIDNTNMRVGGCSDEEDSFSSSTSLPERWLHILHKTGNAAYYVLGNIRHHSDALLIYFSRSKSMWGKVMWHGHYGLFNNTNTEELLTTHPLTSKETGVCFQGAGLNVWKEVGCRSS